jgi:hypothetical protein
MTIYDEDKPMTNSGSRDTGRTPRKGDLISRLASASMCLMIIGFQSTRAEAQAARTYVSGRGSDSNPCSPSSPCLTLQGALSKTAGGGEIYTLDSANYGPVVINKAVSIIAGDGVAGILASNGGTGITINAGANDAVNLQGLEIDGGGSGVNGVLFSSGASLNIKDTVIRGFTTGIGFQPISPSALGLGSATIINNATGLSVQSSAVSNSLVNDVQLMNNGTGLNASPHIS